MRVHRWTIVVLATLLGGANAGLAEIISISGSAEASVQEIVDGSSGDLDEASDTFPGTMSALPLQVAATLFDSDEDAAGIAAAQVADPTTALGTNPSDFALDITLNSTPDADYYIGSATVEEVRTIRFSPTEAGAATGETVSFNGRFFLDGALIIFADASVTDLSDTEVELRVNITQAGSSVFSGTILLRGTSGGTNLSTTGSFPQSQVNIADFSVLVPELSVFQVITFPETFLTFPYEAVVEEEFELRATVSVEAKNQPGVGVAALVGIPISSFEDVVSFTSNAALTQKMITMLKNERAHPTGVPAFPKTYPAPFVLCGLFGFEFVLGLIAFGTLRASRPLRRR